MRTKTLLIAAAALAAGVISSQAQPVYSQNIVGYVNNVQPNGWIVTSAPLTGTPDNTLTNLFQNPFNAGVGEGLLDGCAAYVWNGGSFTEYQLYQPSPTGLVGADGSTPVASPVLTPGTAFFFDNESGAVFTNTFVGTVQIDSGAYPGTSTNLISATTLWTFISPRIPVAGGVTTVCGLTNPVVDVYGGGLLDGEALYIPKYNVTSSGQLPGGYTEVQFFAASPTGFVGADGSTPVPEPIIPVGGGFLFNNANGQPVTWVQSLGQ